MRKRWRIRNLLGVGNFSPRNIKDSDCGSTEAGAPHTGLNPETRLRRIRSAGGQEMGSGPWGTLSRMLQHLVNRQPVHHIKYPVVMYYLSSENE